MAYNYGQQAAQQAAQMATLQAAQGQQNFANRRQNYRMPPRRGPVARFIGLVLKLIVVAVFLLVFVSWLSATH